EASQSAFWSETAASRPVRINPNRAAREEEGAKRLWRIRRVAVTFFRSIPPYGGVVCGEEGLARSFISDARDLHGERSVRDLGFGRLVFDPRRRGGALGDGPYAKAQRADRQRRVDRADLCEDRWRHHVELVCPGARSDVDVKCIANDTRGVRILFDAFAERELERSMCAHLEVARFGRVDLFEELAELRGPASSQGSPLTQNTLR